MVKKKQEEQIKVSNSTEDAIKTIPENPSLVLLHDVIGFEMLLVEQQSIASKIGSYHRLDEWMDVVYGYIRNMLNKNNFINGGPNQNPYANFWWKIYSIPMNICFSPNLKGNYGYSNHHASAYHRNECLLFEIQYLLTKFPNNIEYEI